ncbi:MAG TPA: phosphatidate cytidylyltransferase, partial [Rhizomicrobium sp.]|nr:phosphatidate cytidylyltransferase [Rhizomicrobium sp.]
MSQPQPLHALRSGSEAFLRVLFGMFLAIVAIALVFYSPDWYAAVTVLMALFAAREWHRMVRSPVQRAEADLMSIHVQTAVSAGAIGLAVVALVLRIVPLAFLFLIAGAVAAFVLARKRDDNPLWHAGGVFYIGLPSLALVALRIYPPQGALVVLGLFLIVWATDTGALVFGKL